MKLWEIKYKIRKHFEDNRYWKFKESYERELWYQLSGAIDIDVANYFLWYRDEYRNIIQHWGEVFYFEDCGGCFNIYIRDPKYKEIFDKAENEIGTVDCDECEMYHLHDNDLLWAVVNYEKVVEEITFNVKKYFKKHYGIEYRTKKQLLEIVDNTK